MQKELQKLKEQFFEKDSAAIAEEIADCREPIGVLIDLTEQFAKAFAEKNGAKIFSIMPIWNTLRLKFSCSKRRLPGADRCGAGAVGAIPGNYDR